MEEILRGKKNLPRTQFSTYSRPPRYQTSGPPQERSNGCARVHPGSGFLALVAGVDGYVDGSSKGLFPPRNIPWIGQEFFCLLTKFKLWSVSKVSTALSKPSVDELPTSQSTPSDVAELSWVFGLSATSEEPRSILKSFKFDGRAVTEMITNVVNNNKNERHMIETPKVVFFQLFNIDDT